ncbi:hypothetical protein PMZ80_010538 [Knufia obscura]|uniref:Serine-rich protein n=1 Tax=Knufia obscura TaxID=1635080 RepID=A0ABR0RAK4_9EURO|nr:hypothetical protein PMZ80_010538 [Knufia obscura]
MSSPTTTPKRTPKRTTPKRGPLSERTPSQKNEAAGRLRRESKPDLTDVDIFTTTPFPTKPQHVLLPSTIRKQRSRQNVETELPNLFLNWSQPDISSSATRAQNRQDERRVRRAPKIQLKQSVTALREMYEAQAESSRPSTAIHSRPSTAVASPASRPTSSRLRSVSSSEALSGRSAWDMLGLPKVSADDLAMLPTLSEDVQPLDSEQSFASRVRNQGASSSPNFRTFGTSSPSLPTFHDVATSSDPVEGSSSGLQMGGISSPNFVQLHHSSSMISTDPTPPSLGADEPETSPNIVKLGTSSPKRSSSPTPSEVSTISRKRKRSDMEGSTNAGRTPLFFAGRNRTHSSPPLRNVPASSDASLRSDSRVLPSSPPEAESANSQSQPTSSPVFRMPVAAFSADRSSIVSAHTNLQSVLSSSPGPPLQQPIVRAPNVNQFERLSLQKRNTSGPAKLETDNVQRLSPIQSVANIEVQKLSSTDLEQFHIPRRSASRVSVSSEELDDNLDSESIAPAQAYMIEHDLNSSQINMISDADHHEATDELGALPREHSSFAAALSQARNAGYLSSSSSSNSLSRFDSLRTSLDGRLQSMKSFTYGREDSISYRPGSSASYMSQNVVPTWARRYYSGFYQDSFQYLYQSSKSLGYPVIEVRPSSRRAFVPASIPPSSSYETISTTSNLRQSLSRSVRSSIKSFRLSIPLPTSRPRLNARQSHTTAGVGPLVSNPVRPQSELLSPPPSAYRNRHTIRRVSAPISAVDPRFHWNGIIEEPETMEEAEKLEDHEYAASLQRAESTSARQPWRPSRNSFGPPARFIRLPTPHLHQDRRLHTGSSASHGFGAPYNARPRWQPSDGYTDEVGRPSWFKIDLKDFQVICFMAGFVFPPTWFVAALTPLPTRPTSYHDLEKMEAGLHNSYGAQSNSADDWRQTDIVARLRLEKHIRGLEEVKWQNARWWRRMNRWMCCVGAVVLVIVIVLAVIGTKGHWA